MNLVWLVPSTVNGLMHFTCTYVHNRQVFKVNNIGYIVVTGTNTQCIPNTGVILLSDFHILLPDELVDIVGRTLDIRIISYKSRHFYQ